MASSNVIRKALLVSSVDTFLRAIASLLLLSTTGCVESDRPLTEPENAVADEDIIGLWQEGDDNSKLVSVERVVGEGAPKGLMRARFPNKPDADPHFLWATNGGDVTFLNFPIAGAVFKSPLKGGDIGEYRKWAEGGKRSVWLLMLKREGDQVVLRTSPDGDHQFAGDPEQTQKTLVSDPNKYFSGNELRLTRVRQDAKSGKAAAHHDHPRPMLFMVHHVVQSHLVVEALKAMALHDVPDKEFDALYAKLVRGLEEGIAPLLEQEIKDNAADGEVTSLLKEIAQLQSSVRVEAEAVRRLAIEDAGPKGVMSIVAANLVFEERLAKIMRKLEQRASSGEAAPKAKRVEFEW